MFLHPKHFVLNDFCCMEQFHDAQRTFTRTCPPFFEVNNEHPFTPKQNGEKFSRTLNFLCGDELSLCNVSIVVVNSQNPLSPFPSRIMVSTKIICQWNGVSPLNMFSLYFHKLTYTIMNQYEILYTLIVLLLFIVGNL